MADMLPKDSRPAMAAQSGPRTEVQGIMCEKCNNRLVDLKRQVLRLILPEIQGVLQNRRKPLSAVNTGSLTSRIMNQIHLPEGYLKSWRGGHCDVCTTSMDQLKSEAVAMVHNLEETQFLAYYNIPGYVVGPTAEQLIRQADKYRHQGNATAECTERGLVRHEEASGSGSFLSRAAQKLNLTAKKKQKKEKSRRQEVVISQPMPAPVVEWPMRRHIPPEVKPYPFATNFKEVLRKTCAPLPPSLLKMSKRTDGKVKVMLRVCPSFPGETGSFMKLDMKRKQVTLYDPSTVGHVSQTHRKMGVAAPKMFAFDSIFEADTTQTQMCSASIVDVLQTVVSGSDGCVFSYGHAGLGKTYSMIGRDESDTTMGIIPTALSWLFKLINDQRIKHGTRFSVRVSAVEIVGRSESLRDLLLDQAAGPDNGTANTPSPSVFLRDDKSGTQHATELRVSSAEKAAQLLDAALHARTKPQNDKEQGDASNWEETMNSHMFFTVHVYQYRVDSQKAGEVHGGRSRLHLIDLASCEGYTGSKTSGGASSMSLSGLGNVIIALINGSKHVPHRTSKITKILQESIGNTSCRTTMIAHVSPSLPFYSETLSTAHLASRLHRLRKRKGRKGSGTSSSGGESSCDEARIRRPRMRTAEPRLRTTAIGEKNREDCSLGEPGSSDGMSSTGEESCDTVIYMGPDGALSDRELTDNEGPPARVPIRKTNSTRSLERKLEAIDQDLEENEEEETATSSKHGGHEDAGMTEAAARLEWLNRADESGQEVAQKCTIDDSAIIRRFSSADNSNARERAMDYVIQSPDQVTQSYESGSHDKLERCPSEASAQARMRQSQSEPSISRAKKEAGCSVVFSQSHDSFGKTTTIGITSPETSSESSDADSIVMVEKPSFSFTMCAAVHEVPQPLTVQEVTYRSGKASVAELIEQCEPISPANSVSKLLGDDEARDHWIDDLWFDDTELDWRKSDEGEEELFDGDLKDCLDITFEENEAGELFEEEAGESQEEESSSNQPSEDACVPTNPDMESDETDLNSVAMTTPMKTYYRLVPSPQSSSTEDEMEEVQISRTHDVTGTCLSPILECPSVDENQLESVGSPERVSTDDKASLMDVDESCPSSPRVSSPARSSKGDLRSLLKVFVAEQLRECEEGELMPRFSKITCRPQPRRVHPFPPEPDPEDDPLLPPLTPQQHAASDVAKVVPSPKLPSRAEWETSSDPMCYGRDMRETDESSDGTAKTEPWTVTQSGQRETAVRRAHHVRAARTISSVGVSAASASVTFLGCVDENNNYVEEKEVESRKSGNEKEAADAKERRRSTVHSVIAENSLTRKNSRPSRVSTSSFVKLTYCGSELSDADLDSRDEVLSDEEQNRGPKVSAVFQRPKIERISIAPCSPYAPQEEYKQRYNERDRPARIVYRFSGEFTATLPPLEEALDKREYRVSGEYVATVTTNAHGQSSHSLTMTSCSTVDSGKPESMDSVDCTEVVWVLNDALVSSSVNRARRREKPAPLTSIPGETPEPVTSTPSKKGANLAPITCTPIKPTEEKATTGKWKFSRDRGSVSSGHASDSSVPDSPHFRRGRRRSLWRSKSAARCETASSSGYESMRNDTSQASSDSCSERGFGSSKRRGFRKRTRSDSPSRRRLSPRRWFSRKSLDTVEIKVYEVDDFALIKGPTQHSGEQRQMKLNELRSRQRQLKSELTEVKSRLGEEKRWSFGLRADKTLARDDPRFVGALEYENRLLEQRIEACKSNVMMVTSFDALVTQV